MAQIDFIGPLGADSEIKFTRGGSPVLNFRVGDSKSRKQENGEWETIAQNWFNCEIWGSDAEHFAEKLTKGVRVRVFGEFYQREYDGRNGRGVSLDVKVHGIQVLTPKSSRPAAQDTNPGAWDPTPNQSAAGWGAQPAAGGGWGGQQQPSTGWGNSPSQEPPF